MEFGPRALGARSIIGDARSPEMQRIMNLKIKYREGFRPFAPSVLNEYTDEWFEMKVSNPEPTTDCEIDSPYMLLVGYVKEGKRKEVNPEDENLKGIDKLKTVRSDIPAVTHVDYSARLQTVHKETNPLYTI